MRFSFAERLRALDPVLTALTLGLLVFGLVMLADVTNVVSFQRTGDSLYLFKRQIEIGVLPGTFLFLMFALIDYRTWKKFAGLALIASYSLLILVYIPGIGREIGGSHSWIGLGPILFQPSEIVKLTFLIYLAAWLSERKPESLRDIHEGLVPFVSTLGVLVLLLVLQPDTGSTAVIAGTAGLLFLLAGAPISWFVGMAAFGFGGLWILIKTSPYRMARFMTFLHPELDPKGVGYHINQAILAVATGGWFGVGFGKSRQKFLYLPEVEADSIFAIIAEELGLIFTLAFLAVFAALVWRCFKISADSKDRFGAYLAAGVGIWLSIQAALNIGSMVGLVPITGVTLPFVSHGGTAMAMLLAAMGLVAGIPRHSQRV
ncbi:MAG TPA: putative lipid II flippase FtsW [Verrucomicrobiae bacterium]|nr:putative lipid II flippase FtsW [Verrucomicrobiae bacterium]